MAVFIGSLCRQRQSGGPAHASEDLPGRGGTSAAVECVALRMALFGHFFAKCTPKCTPKEKPAWGGFRVVLIFSEISLVEPRREHPNAAALLARRTVV